MHIKIIDFYTYIYIIHYTIYIQYIFVKISQSKNCKKDTFIEIS